MLYIRRHACSKAVGLAERKTLKTQVRETEQCYASAHETDAPPSQHVGLHPSGCELRYKQRIRIRSSGAGFQNQHCLPRRPMSAFSRAPLRGPQCSSNLVEVISHRVSHTHVMQDYPACPTCLSGHVCHKEFSRMACCEPIFTTTTNDRCEHLS
jgi:hypothetical protein